MPVVQVEEPDCESCHFDAEDAAHAPKEVPYDVATKDLFLVATKDCPKCKQATEFLIAAKIPFTKVYAEDDATLVHQFGLIQAPVLIDMRGEEVVLYNNLSDIRKFIEG
jgi:ribonucleoside-triphosphate reductase